MVDAVWLPASGPALAICLTHIKRRNYLELPLIRSFEWLTTDTDEAML